MTLTKRDQEEQEKLRKRYNADKDFRRYRMGITQHPLNCINCGACCRSMGLSISKEDIAREPRLLKFVTLTSEVNPEAIKTWDETDKYCLLIGSKFKIQAYKACPFLKNNKCSIYETRPEVCRSHPVNLFECKKSALIEAGMPGADIDNLVKNAPLPTVLFQIWIILQWDPKKVTAVLDEINPNNDKEVFFNDRICDIFYDEEDSVKAQKENLERFTSAYGEDFKLYAFK